MDLSTVAAGVSTESTLKEPAHEVVDLTSDSTASSPEVARYQREAVEQAKSEHASEVVVRDVEEGSDTTDDEEWEDDSTLGSLIEEIRDDELPKSPVEGESCTLEEATAYRRRLRKVGPLEFCQQTVENGSISAKKLLTAFGIKVPALEGAEDGAYYQILGRAIHRELHTRYKLPQYNTVDDAVGLLQKSKNIMVITGAGISTSLGIPDFRSKNTGLYAQLEHLGLNDPQEVFDIDLFRENPLIFFSVAKGILPDTKRFSPTHAFIKLIHDQGKLLTNYTQNIDNLEHWAGVPAEKLVQCHGSFGTASCTLCRFQVPGETVFDEIKAGNIPRCTRCKDALLAQKGAAGMKRKRSKIGARKKRGREDYDDSSEEEDTDLHAGIMKPDITFFGEALPDTFHNRITGHDKNVVDLVIVIGTSLKVAPVSDVIPFLSETVPQIYISREPVTHLNFDIDLLGDCDVVVAELCKRAGWKLQHDMIPEDQVVRVDSIEGYPSRHIFVAKSSGSVDVDEL